MEFTRNIKTILLLLIIYSTITIAQQPTLEWVKRYPDTANSFGEGKIIKIDNSGNLVITGSVIINEVWHY